MATPTTPAPVDPLVQQPVATPRPAGPATTPAVPPPVAAPAAAAPAVDPFAAGTALAAAGAPAAPAVDPFAPAAAATPGAPGSPTEAGDRSSSPFGIFTNLYRDVKDMAKGFGTLGGVALSDAAKLVTGLPTGYANTHFLMDDIIKGMPHAIAADYSSRYGTSTGLLGGHISQLWEHPLAFITDALLVGDAEAKLADIAGKGAIEAGSAAGELGAKTVADEAGMLNSTVDEAGKLVPAQLTADQVSSAAKFVNRVQGSSTKVMDSTGRIQEIVADSNPVKRMLLQRPYLKAITQGGGTQAELANDALQTVFASGPEGLDYAKAAHDFNTLLNGVSDPNVEGMRQFRSWAEASRTRKFVDRLVGSNHAIARSGLAEYDAKLKAVADMLPEQVPPEMLGDAARGLDMSGNASEYKVANGTTRAAEHFDAPAGAQVDHFTPDSNGWLPYASPEGAQVGVDGWTTALDDQPAVFDGSVPLGKAQTPPAEPDYVYHVTNPESYQGIKSSGELEPRGLSNKRVWFSDTPESARTYADSSQGEQVLLRARNTAVDGSVDTDLLRSSKAVPTGELDVWTGAGWKPVQGGDPVKAAMDIAKQDQADAVTALREEFKPGQVPTPKLRDEASARLKHALYGALPDDMSRARILDDAFYTDPKVVDEAIAKVEKATGGKVRFLKNTIHSPAEDGSRMVRLVVDMPGDSHPFEVQLMSPHEAYVQDISQPLRAANDASLAALQDSPQAGHALRILKNNLMMQDLHSGVTADIREALGGHTEEAFRKAQQALREATFEHLTGPAIRDLGLDPQVAFDEQYTALRMRNGAEYSKDATVQGFIGGGSPLENDKLFREAGNPTPQYIPEVRPSKLPGANDLMSKDGDVAKAIREAVDPFQKKNDHVLLRSGMYEKDPIKALHMRAMAASRASERYAVLTGLINKVGRPIESLGDADPAREVVLSMDSLQKLHQTQAALTDAILASKDPGSDVANSAAEALKKISVDSLNGDITEGRYVAVPKVAARRIQQFGELVAPDGVDLIAGTPTRVFKNLALMSPGFLLRHTFRLAAYTWMNDGSIVRVLRQLDPAFRQQVIDAMPEEAQALVDRNLAKAAVGTAREYSDETFAGAVGDAMQQSDKAKSFLNIVRKPQLVLRKIQVGIEDAFRREGYLSGVDKAAVKAGVDGWSGSFMKSQQSLDAIYKAGLDPAIAKSATENITKMFADYDNLSPLARSVISPYLVPFWPAYKFAAKTLVQFPFESPGKATLMRFIQETADAQNSKFGNLPGWAQGAIPMDPGGNPSDLRFLNATGLDPFNIVGTSPANLLNPAVKMLFEQATGVKTYNGKPFTSPDVFQPPGSGQAFKVNPDGSVEAVDKVTPGLLEQVMQSVPQYQLAKDMLAAGKTYDTASLPSILQGNGVIMDPATGQPKYPSSFMDSLYKFFGYSTYNLDTTQLQASRTADATAALKAYMAAHPAPAAAPKTDPFA